MPNHLPATLTFYKACCFDLSPTWGDWARLTAADVYALEEREGFQEQKPNIYFYLNHPIRWVCLIGVIVAFDVYDRRFIMILDDSSGATMEVVCGRANEQLPNAKFDLQQAITAKATPSTAETEEHYTPGLTAVDLTGVDVGSVVKIKGTVGTFRESRQILLERLWILRTTNDEAAAWAKTATYKRDVLSKPWVLTDKEQRQAEREAQGYEAKKKAKEEYKRKKQALEEEKRRRAKHRARRRAHAEALDPEVAEKRDDRHEPNQRPRRERKEGIRKHRPNDA